MAKVKIIQQENGIGIQIDDNAVPYNVVEWAVHQSSGEKPVLTFLAPMSVEVDSLSIEDKATPVLEPQQEAPKFIG